MKIIMERDALAPALDEAGRIVRRTSPIPINQCLLITAGAAEVTICAHSMDCSLEVAAPAEVQRPGSVAIFADTLRSIVKDIPKGGQITIEVDEAKATLRFGRSRYNLPALPAGDFPPFISFEGKGEVATFSLSSDDIARLLVGMRPFISKSEKVPYLRAVWLHRKDGRLWGMGSDSYMMIAAYTDLPEALAASPLFTEYSDEDRTGIMIPEGAIEGIARTCEAGGEISTNGRVVVAERPGMRFAGLLLNNSVPPMWRVIPEVAADRVTVDREELAATIRRICAVGGKTRRMALQCEPDGATLEISLSSNAKGQGWEEVSASAEGRFAAVVDPDRLLLIIGHLRGETVSFSRHGDVGNIRVEDSADGALVAAFAAQKDETPAEYEASQ